MKADYQQESWFHFIAWLRLWLPAYGSLVLLSFSDPDSLVSDNLKFW